MAKDNCPHIARTSKVQSQVIRAVIDRKTRETLLKNKHSARDFQLDAAVRVADGHDTILIAPTGSGKTLVLAMPLLYHSKKTSLVLSPLHALETDQVKKMNDAGIPSLLIDTVDLPASQLQDILRGKYRLLFTSPELLEENPKVAKLLSMKAFRSHLHAVDVDEAHCISQWGEEFRPAYARIGTLRALTPPNTPFFVTSATMPPKILEDVMNRLGFASSTPIIQLSNNRPNVQLTIREMIHSKSSFRDLDFLVPEGVQSTEVLQRAIVYLDTQKLASDVGEYLRKRITYRHNTKCPPVAHYHAGMSDEYKMRTLADFIDGRIAILCATEAAGMGCDIPDVKIVVQCGLPKSLCTFVQRFGRCARDPTIEGEAILLVEKGLMDPPKKSPEESTLDPVPTRASSLDAAADTMVAATNHAVGDTPHLLDRSTSIGLSTGPLDQPATSADDDDRLWESVELSGVNLTSAELDKYFDPHHSPSTDSRDVGPQIRAPQEKKRGRPTRIANRHRNEATQKRKGAIKARGFVQDNAPKPTDIKKDMIAFVQLKTCFRANLNKYFGNPPPPDGILALPGRCCSACNPAPEVEPIPGDSLAGVHDGTNNDDELAPKIGKRIKRSKGEFQVLELREVLETWREAKTNVLQLASDQFVIPDQDLDTIVSQAGRITSVEVLNELTKNHVAFGCARELCELITETVKDTKAAREAKSVLDKETARERQRESSRRSRLNAKSTLEVAMEVVNELGNVLEESLDDAERELLTSARAIVEKANTDKLKRSQQATVARANKKRKREEEAGKKEGVAGESSVPGDEDGAVAQAKHRKSAATSIDINTGS